MIIRIARQNSKQWKPNKTINPRVDSLSGCQVGPSPLWYSHLGLFCKRKCWITSITIQTCEWHVLLSVVNKSIVSYCLLVTYNSFLTFTFPVTRCMVSSLSFLWCFKSKRLEESSGMFLYTTAFSSTTTQAVASCSLLAALSIQVRCLLTVVGFLSSTHTIKKTSICIISSYIWVSFDGQANKIKRTQSYRELHICSYDVTLGCFLRP